MQTTRCHKFIQVSVIKMLMGDIGREAGGTVRPAQTTHAWPCVKVISAAHVYGVVTDSSKTFFSMNRPILMCKLYPLLRAGNLVNTAKEVRPPCYISHFSPKFSLRLSKMLNHVRYRVGLDMKYFWCWL